MPTRSQAWASFERDPVQDGLIPSECLLVVEAWQPFEPRVGTGVTDIDDQEGTPAAVRKEIGIDARCVEPGHRTSREPVSADREDEIASLQGGIERSR